MRWPALARTTHKWLGLVIAIQAVLWTLSGVYMTAIHIDIIHGDRLVRRPDPAPIALEGLVEPAHLAHLAPGLTAAKLEVQLGRPVWIVETVDGKALLDAKTGETLSPLGAAAARARAKALFAEDGAVRSVELLNEAPQEIRGRAGPVWRVTFDGAWRPTFYISPATGELVARRHDLWRAYDLVWMLHIMDYAERDNPATALNRVFTWLSVAGAATGGWLLLYSFRRRRRPKAAG